MTSAYLAPAPRQLDIVTDTVLARDPKLAPSCQPNGAAENGGYLSTARETKTRGHLSIVPQKETGPYLSTADMKKLDARRRRFGIAIPALCAAAGLHPNTYNDAKSGRSRTRRSTCEKLNAALNRLAAGAAADDRRTLCQMMLRLVTAQFSRAAGWDPAQVLAQDFSKEAATPVWRQAARMRRCAIYLLVEGGGIGKATIGHAIGITRQAVQKAVAEIEAARDGDHAFDALMQTMMVQLKGDL